MQDYKVEEATIFQHVGSGQLEIYMGKAMIPWYVLMMDFFRNSVRILSKPL